MFEIVNCTSYGLKRRTIPLLISVLVTILYFDHIFWETQFLMVTAEETTDYRNRI